MNNMLQVKSAICERIKNNDYKNDNGISGVSRLRKIQKSLINTVIMIEIIINTDYFDLDNN